MTSDLIIATVLVGLSLLDRGVLRLAPDRVRLVAGAGLFALLTVAVTSMAGSPLQPAFAGAGPASRLWQQVIVSAWWLLGARLLVRLAKLALRHRGLPREGRLFSDLLAGLLYLAVLLTIVSAVFGLPVGGLVATSGVIAIVLGLALQSTLADVFAGVAVGIERPYAIGDQVWLDGPIEGEVTQINWRSVRIRTFGNDVATVPNSLVAKSRIINRSFPSPLRSDGVRLPCDPAVEPQRVIDLIHRAILLCPQILEAPAPSVVLARLGGRSNDYDVSFSVAGSGVLAEARSTLLQQVLRQFRSAGIAGTGCSSAPATNRSARKARPRRPDLAHIPLFQELPPAARRWLEARLVRHALELGQVLFSQGDTEASLFVVTSGVLEVSRTSDGVTSRVGRIGAGDYIGEIGLLTGAAHAASVTALTPCTVFELSKDQVAPLLAERPDVLHRLEISARRGQALLDRSVAASVGAATLPSGPLLDRIRAFFHLHG
jgi:small-conductance mechanosensitive channel